MAKVKQTPGAALNALLKKHGLNYNRLAKAIGLSSAMVRLIARDENPVSASVAFRLAKFFKTKPEYWLALQMEFDNAKAAQDKKLAKALKGITTVDKATFERRPRTTKTKSTKAKPAKKGKSTRGRKAAAKGAAAKPKKTAAKSAAAKKKSLKSAKPAGKRGRPAAKKVKSSKAVVKKAKAKPAPKPIITIKPESKPAAVQHPAPPVQQPSVPPETKINEPQI